MRLKDQKVAITGAGGMLGRALNDILGPRTSGVIALSHRECDIAKPQDRRAIFDHRPTIVFNCAAHTKVDQCEQEPELANAINGIAVGDLARLCRENNAFLVHVSTDFVFDGASTRPYRPDDPVRPLSAYGRSKLLGETELQRSDLSNWLIVRTAWVYGRGGANFPRTIIQAARANKPLKVVADQFGAPTYTAHLAEAILALLQHDARGVWHVTNSGQTTWHEFAVAALRQFGLANDITPITSADWQKIKPASAIRPQYSVLDLAPFEKLAGRPMASWRQGLKDFHQAVETAGEF
ncbi:MAG TPA: dTDP-4-dehydrorhamnose reductase [Tepidisphaeraceae bacterium]|nr:dTDP-4-dehydrorhamnose reductase [Tepidisphaeraceae bacterium]